MTANPAMRATMAGKDSLDSGANDLRATGARTASEAPQKKMLFNCFHILETTRERVSDRH